MPIEQDLMELVRRGVPSGYEVIMHPLDYQALEASIPGAQDSIPGLASYLGICIHVAPEHPRGTVTLARQPRPIIFSETLRTPEVEAFTLPERLTLTSGRRHMMRVPLADAAQPKSFWELLDEPDAPDD